MHEQRGDFWECFLTFSALIDGNSLQTRLRVQRIGISSKGLRVPSINDNDVIVCRANPILDRFVKPGVKALLVLLIRNPERALAFSYPSLTLIRKNIRLAAVHVPVLGDLVDGAEDAGGDVMVEPVLSVQVDC